MILSKSKSTLLEVGIKGGDDGAEEIEVFETNLRPSSLNLGMACESFVFTAFLALAVSVELEETLEDRLDSSWIGSKLSGDCKKPPFTLTGRLDDTREIRLSSLVSPPFVNTDKAFRLSILDDELKDWYDEGANHSLGERTLEFPLSAVATEMSISMFISSCGVEDFLETDVEVPLEERGIFFGPTEGVTLEFLLG